MFHINSFVLIFLHQVVFSISFECFPVAFEGVNCTITRKVTQTTLVWKKDGNSILSSTYQATNSCIANPPSTEYAEYCFDDSTQKVFVLEILNPENHAGSNFSDGITGELTTINLMEPNNLSSGDLNITYTITADTVDVSVIVPCCNPQPTFTWNFKTSKSVSVENSQTSTDSTGCASSLLKRLSSLSVNLKTLDSEFTQTSGYFEISVDVKFGDRKTVSSVPITVKYNAPGSSSPPTLSPSSSSPPNPSTTYESPPTTTFACDKLICDPDITVIIIIAACVGSLIVVVVIILSCCCCPCCPCYRRNKEERDEKECKCCSLICYSKKHDEESETRERVCECCCCPFCVCYKRKKKTDDRKNKQNAPRSQQYQMNRTNHSTNMNSGLNDQVRRPNQPTHASQSTRPTKSNYATRSTDSNYATRSTDSNYTNRPTEYNYATRPTESNYTNRPTEYNYATRPTESYHGRGYNNAAFVYHGANERGRDMDRKPRVIQRPYNNHY